MKTNHASMTKHNTTKQIRWLGNAQLSNKRRRFLPEEKMFAKYIQYMISNMLKSSNRWIKNNIRNDILNYYCIRWTLDFSQQLFSVHCFFIYASDENNVVVLIQTTTESTDTP